MAVSGRFVFIFCLMMQRSLAAQFVSRFSPSEETTLRSLCDSLTISPCTCPTDQPADSNVTSYNVESGTTAIEMSRFGDGYDGELVVPQDSCKSSVVVNYYAIAKGHNPKGTSSISVSDTKLFRVGREVCVMQMKGNNAGTSMFARVVAKNENNLTLNVGLDFNCSTSGSVDRCQVVTVPHFTTVILEAEATLTGRQWNGYTGGVIVFRAKKKVDVGPYHSKITACGLGFKGGPGGKSLQGSGMSGESYNGEVSYTSSRNYGGGGGGTYCSYDGSGRGGAGAGHLSGGYDVSRSCRYSSYYSYGGLSYGFSSVTEYLFMGSGGGGGVRGSQCCGLSGRGGNGGGIIIISSPVLTGNGGAVTACATKGQDTGRSLKTAGVHGAGGGGSGGSILIMTSLSTISGVVNVDVEGGPGGTSVSSSNSNGGGGSQGQQTIVDTILSGPTYSFWI